MKVLFKHAKLIFIIFTIINVGLTLLFYNTKYFDVIIKLFAIELVILLMFISIVLYKWINELFIKIKEENFNSNVKLEQLQSDFNSFYSIFKEAQYSDKLEVLDKAMNSIGNEVVSNREIIQEQARINLERLEAQSESLAYQLVKIESQEQNSLKQEGILERLSVELKEQVNKADSQLKLLEAQAVKVARQIELSDNLTNETGKQSTYLETQSDVLNKQIQYLETQFVRFDEQEQLIKSQSASIIEHQSKDKEDQLSKFDFQAKLIELHNEKVDRYLGQLTEQTNMLNDQMKFLEGQSIRFDEQEQLIKTQTLAIIEQQSKGRDVELGKLNEQMSLIEAQNQKIETQKEMLIKQFDAISSQKNILESQSDKIANQTQILNSSNNSFSEELKQLQARTVEINKQTQLLGGQSSKLNSQTDELSGQLEKLELSRVTAHSQVEQLENNNKFIEIQLSKLEDQNKKLNDFSLTLTPKKYEERKFLEKQLDRTYDRIDALMSIHNLLKLNAPLPIMHNWRVSSDYAHEVLSCFIETKGTVIDIGSGISTLLFGYAVKRNGNGKVISLEHSKEYFEKTKALIKLHQLEEYCELYYCPLIEYNIEGKKWLWYDVKNVALPNKVSLISIDGPPGDTQYLARYPALTILKETIGKGTVIYLDDGNREQEREIAKQWTKKFNLNTVESNDYKGYFKMIKI